MKPNNTKQNAVLSFPYEGGLYYLFSRENPSGAPRITGHPYYESLYGRDPLRSKDDAVNLMTLFDELLLPPADEYLPGFISCQDGREYYHPDLRVRASGDWEFTRGATDIAKSLMSSKEISDLFVQQVDLPKDRQQAELLLGRVIEQLRLALKHNAVILGGHTAGLLATRVWRLIQHGITEIGALEPCPQFVAFGDESFNVTALTWNCSDVDSLKAIRTSPEVSAYSRQFRKALLAASGASDMSAEMRRLMREAMQHESIARMVKGFFEVAGIISTYVSTLPDLGLPATFAGLGTVLGYKKAERIEDEHRWYLLGTKIREAGLKHMLQKE